MNTNDVSQRVVNPSNSEFYTELRRSLCLFLCGKYSKYIDVLENLKIANDKAMAPFIVENNLISCHLVKELHTEEEVNEDSVQKYVKDFNILFHKVQSFPPSGDVLCSELLVLHNLMYSTLLCDPRSRKESIMRNLQHSIPRVLKYFKQTCNTGYDGDACPQDIIQYMQKLSDPSITRKSNDKKSVIFRLVSALSIWCVSLLHDDNRAVAAECLVESLELVRVYGLDSFRDSDSIFVSLDSGPVEIKPCMRSPDNEHIPLSDPLHLLLAICSYPANRIKCMKHLLQMGGSSWEPLAVYMKASIHYENGDYGQTVQILQDLLSFHELLEFDADLQSKMLNLLGSGLSNLGKVHIAIEKYKQALETKFAYLVPLYNIAKQYNVLSLYDAELEALNLLVTALESKPADDGKVLTISSILASDVFTSETAQPAGISLLEALYALSRRCLELTRYEVAAQRYMDLLFLISDNKVAFAESRYTAVRVPGVRCIYQEAIFSLLAAKRYQDCITVCDQTIMCYTMQRKRDEHPPGVTDAAPNSGEILDKEGNSHSISSRKRQRSESHTTITAINAGSWLTTLDIDVTAVMYKAEALFYLNELTSAKDCLLSIVETLESFFTMNERISTNSMETNDSPVFKRQRLDTQLKESTLEDTELQNPAIPLLTSVYCNLATVLIGLLDYEDAVHFCRLGLQMKSDHTRLAYNLSVTMRLQNRWNDGATWWLSFRGDYSAMDSCQLSNELRKKQVVLRSNPQQSEVPWSDEITIHQRLQLDILALQQILQSKRNKHS